MAAVLFCSPTRSLDALRQALIGSLYHAHRPELADLVASADLDLDPNGAELWLRPLDPGLNPAWLEAQLGIVAFEEGFPSAWIRVLRGREA